MVSIIQRMAYRNEFAILMQTGQEILVIEDQHLVTYFRLVEKLSLGAVRNNHVLPYGRQKQNTLHLPMQLRKQYG